jgi:hypothetical protein
MSSGGQRGIDVSGVGGMRLRDASDTTTQRQLQLTYQTYASPTGANAFMGDLVNSTYAFLRFKEGLRESVGSNTGAGCATCSDSSGEGLGYSLNPTSGYPWAFRNRY